MPLNEIAKFLSQLPPPGLSPREGECRNYHLKTCDIYIDHEGEPRTRQCWELDYSREITEVDRPNLFLTRLRLHYPQSGRERQQLDIPFYLYNRRVFFQEGDNDPEAMSWHQTVKEQSRLSVKSLTHLEQDHRFSLICAQIADVMDLEALNGHFLCVASHLCQRAGVIKKIKTLPLPTRISHALSSHRPQFFEGKLYGSYQGVNVYRGGLCHVFGFQGEAATLVKKDCLDNENTGSIFRSGEIYLEAASGMVVKASLHENFFSELGQISSIDPISPRKAPEIRHIHLEITPQGDQPCNT